MQAGDSVLFMMGVIVMNGNFNPYDVPPDDLPEGCTSKEKPVSVALLIWDKLPQILLYAGLCAVILGVVWGCHHG